MQTVPGDISNPALNPATPDWLALSERSFQLAAYLPPFQVRWTCWGLSRILQLESHGFAPCVVLLVSLGMLT
jgi:hypothetical protein